MALDARRAASTAAEGKPQESTEQTVDARRAGQAKAEQNGGRGRETRPWVSPQAQTSGAEEGFPGGMLAALAPGGGSKAGRGATAAGCECGGRICQRSSWHQMR